MRPSRAPSPARSAAPLRLMTIAAVAAVSVAALVGCTPREQSAEDACAAVGVAIDAAGADSDVMLDAGSTNDPEVLQSALVAFHEGLTTGREKVTNEAIAEPLDRMIAPMPTLIDSLDDVDEVMDLSGDEAVQQAGEEFSDARREYAAACAGEQ